MNKDLHVEIISPRGYLFNGSCTMVIVPALDGLMGIMHGHESVLSPLKEGKVVVQDDKQNINKEFDIVSGVVEMIGGDKLLVLVD